MKLGIGPKLGLFASLLIVGTVMILYAWVTLWSGKVLLDQSALTLGYEAREIGDDLYYHMIELPRDGLLPAQREVRNFLRQPQGQRAASKLAAAKAFEDILGSHMEFLHLAFVPATADDGERIETATGVLRRAGRVECQSDGIEDFPGIDRLPATVFRAYPSAVRQDGRVRIDGAPVPYLHVVSPVHIVPSASTDRQSVYRGALVATVDFRWIAQRLRVSPMHLVYVANAAGEYLVHPDSRLEFAAGEDAGGRGRLPAVVAEEIAKSQQSSGPAESLASVGARSRRSLDLALRQPWDAGCDIYFLRVQIKDPSAWEGDAAARGAVRKQLRALRDRGHVVSALDAGALQHAREIVIRGVSAEALHEAGQGLERDFGQHLLLTPVLSNKRWVAHYSRLELPSVDVPEPLRQSFSLVVAKAAPKDSFAEFLFFKLLLIGAGVALAFLFSLWLTRPLREMTAATRALADGIAADVRLPVRAGGEIGELARSFEHMLEKIRGQARQVRDNEGRVRAIVQTAAEGIVTTNEHGAIESFNQAAERIFRRRAKEILGQPIRELIPGWQPPGEPSLASADPTGSSRLNRVQVTVRESEGLLRDGTRIPIELSISEVHVGGVQHVTTIVRDITERRRTEQEIRQLNENLKAMNEALEQRVRQRTELLEKTNAELAVARDQALEASRTKSAFLAQMSHELRTPLNAIKGYGELLLEEAQERGLDDFQADLRKILHSGAHLLALINDVLDLSRIEANKVELYLEDFDIGGLVQSVGATVEPMVRKNENRFEVLLGKDLGVMRADQKRLKQVLLNLLSNAAKFTKRGVVTLDVHRERGERGDCDWVAFHVRDTGIGIPAEQIPRLFQPFSQVAASAAPKIEGTGLGLAISRRFCRLMGGDVTLASVYGQGSEFIARLPAQVRDAGAPADRAAPAAPAAPTLNRRSILVIDDDPSARDVLRRFLEKEGFAVAVAADGAEGLRLARELRPAVITLDVLLPQSDGWSVLSALKADPVTRDIPVVMLTIVDDRNLGIALGAVEYLTKPIDRDRLLEVLRKFSADARRSVLVVEDDAATRDVLRRLLEREGWSVVEATDGQAGLDCVARAAPALIVLDLMMPVLDGFEFVTRLRNRPDGKRIPVVVLTAKELTAEDRSALAGGVAKVLEKGACTREQLLVELKELLRLA